MKLGAHFLPEDLPVFLESVREADAVGYERAWLVDGQMLWHDIWIYLTHGLAATERLAFGTGVTNPLTRHFTVTASAAATLAVLYPGRMLLGLGRGDNAVRTLGLQPVPTRRLAEVVPKIRSLVAGRPIDLDGTEVRIRWANEDVPIMMSATGPKNLRVAGGLADIVMIYVGVNPCRFGGRSTTCGRARRRQAGTPTRWRSQPSARCGSPKTSRRLGTPAAGRRPRARTTSRTSRAAIPSTGCRRR